MTNSLRAGSASDLILATIRAQGASGATDDQVTISLSISNSTVRHARRALADLGLVRNTGRTRLTSEGRLAAVWRYQRPETAAKATKASSKR